MIEVVALATLIAFAIWLTFIVPMQMAQRRERSAVMWVLISVFLSPLIAILGLFVLGDA